MSKPPFEVKAGFVPYSDGSGYQVDVEIDQEYAGAEITMRISTVYKFEISEWPNIRAGIDRLLRAAPAVIATDQKGGAT